MERIQQGLLKHYSAVKVFLDDLRDIAHILEGARSFSISTGDYKCSSMDEFVENFKARTLGDITIKTSDPYATLEMSRLDVHLFVSSGDTEGAGIFYKLDKVISRTRRWPSFLYRIYTLLIANGAMLVLGRFVPGRVYLVILVPFMLWFWWGFYVSMFKTSVIVVNQRHDAPGFFARSRDQLALNIINSVVSLLVGAVFGVLIGPYVRDFLQSIAN